LGPDPRGLAAEVSLQRSRIVRAGRRGWNRFDPNAGLQVRM